MYSSGLNIEVQGELLQVAALLKTLNWEPLQVETSVQSELRSRLDPWSTMILIKMSIVDHRKLNTRWNLILFLSEKMYQYI